MSYTSDVRGELARLPFADACCARSELNAALLCSGGIAWRGRNRYGVTLTTADAPTVRRYFAMVKQFYGVVGQIRTIASDTLNGQMRYQLALPESDGAKLLEALDLLDPAQPFGIRPLPSSETLRFACCKKSFARAAFLMCGAINPPEKKSHFEIAAPGEALAQCVAEQFHYFDIDVRVSPRKLKSVVYLKRAESIADALTLLGASAAVLTFENTRIKKEVSNQVNRRLNCDNSNINRVMQAAETQLADIRYIDSELGLDKLPKPLRDMAEARMNAPGPALGELGELLDPPIGKSGVNARLRKLADIANKLRCGEEVRL